jgi:hypothetical protein
MTVLAYANVVGYVATRLTLKSCPILGSSPCCDGTCVCTVRHRGCLSRQFCSRGSSRSSDPMCSTQKLPTTLPDERMEKGTGTHVILYSALRFFLPLSHIGTIAARFVSSPLSMRSRKQGISEYSFGITTRASVQVVRLRALQGHGGPPARGAREKAGSTRNIYGTIHTPRVALL